MRKLSCVKRKHQALNDDAKSWRKLGRPEQMMFDSTKSRRARDEQADSPNGMAHFEQSREKDHKK